MRFRIGDIVYHETFGLGKVVSYADWYYCIEFVNYSNYGIKKITENSSCLQAITTDALIENLSELKKLMKSSEYLYVSDIRNLFNSYYPTYLDLGYITQDFLRKIAAKHNRDLFNIKISEKIALKDDYISVKEQEKLKELYENNKINDDGFLRKLVENHNKKFMKKEVERYPEAFITVDKNPLNEEQKIAVVADEDNCLVIAGAGCGKTSTLLGKIKYLLYKGVSPDRMLVLSYTNKTVEDLNNKLKQLNAGIKAQTFHSLGFDIIKEKNKEYKCDDNITIGNILRQILYPEHKNKFEIKNIGDLFENIKRLFLELIAYVNEKNISTDLEKYAIDNEENKSFPTLKAEIKYFENQKKSIKGESVKSLAEVKIANFLFLNGIDYEYEKVYDKPYLGQESKTNKQYKPDFYIKTAENEGIWLEHFGVTTDEQGNKHASWCKDEAKYLQQMEEKIQTHKGKLLYTTSDMLHNGTLLTELKKMLSDRGVVLKPITDDKIREYLNKLQNLARYESFINRIERAINLFKSQKDCASIESWRDAVLKKTPDIYHPSANKLFEIIAQIYKLYQQTLAKNHCIDFAEMISKAINKIKTNQIKRSYDYILIDEYQDITQIRYEFVKALREVNNAKITVVGDDWQSIYGFNGSDISLFTKFTDFFKDAKELYVTENHRNPQQLLEITTKFIMKNKSQIGKTLRTDNNDEKYPLKAVLYHPDKQSTDMVDGCEDIKSALMIALDEILAKKKENETLCIIGRYNPNTPNTYNLSNNSENDIYYVENQGVYSICYQGERIGFSTIHKAKGLEWDYTIFLNGMFDENEIHSFPCALPDDYLMQPLLYRTDSYQYAEERRMLYVALTRCRKQCYWLISEKRPTPFYEEMSQKIEIINDTLENYCKKTNKTICPKCKRGWMVERTNKETHEKFLGCTNYPACNYTKNLKK